MIILLVVVVLGMFVLLSVCFHTAGHSTPHYGPQIAGRTPVATARGPPRLPPARSCLADIPVHPTRATTTAIPAPHDNLRRPGSARNQMLDLSY